MPNIGQWRNSFELSSFPFMDGMSPSLNGAIVDARINLPPQSSGAYLKQIISSGDRTTFSVHSIGGGNIGSGVISREDPSFVELLNSDGVHAGILVLSPGVKFVNEMFTEKTARFETACLVPSPFRRVSVLVVGGRRIPGKIALAEGDGIRLIKAGDESVRIDAIGSTDKNEECCQDILDPLLGLNDAVPDEYGNISLSIAPYDEPSAPESLMQILRISPIINGIEFSLAK